MYRSKSVQSKQKQKNQEKNAIALIPGHVPIESISTLAGGRPFELQQEQQKDYEDDQNNVGVAI